MENCHHNIEYFDFFGLGEFGLLLSVFLTGLAASFTHCMAMCGPLAMMQANIRLMNIPYSQTTQFAKIKAALTLPYYFGKAVSYSVIFVVMLALATHFRSFTFCNNSLAILMMLTGSAFIYMGITKNFSVNLPIPFIQTFSKKISKLSNFLKLQPYGFKGFALGIILGFIPCALVIAIIMTILAATQNLLIGLAAILLFALSTVPGLFLASYLGNMTLSSFKNYSSILFRLLSFFNAYLLFSYSYAILNL
jgi:uncharacterized protein